MADSKVSALTADTDPTDDDLVYTVNDPGGTPASRQATRRNFRGKNHKLVTRATGSDMVLNSSSIAELAAASNGPGSGGFDIALKAATGDVLEWGFNALVGPTGDVTTFDIYTMVSGSRTNPFGAGLSASAASTLGVAGWYSGLFSGGAPLPNLRGSALYVVQSGDIASGVVTCRPHYVMGSATNRTLYSSTNVPLMMWCKNLGPVQT